MSVGNNIKNNIMICSAGRHYKIVKNIKSTVGEGVVVVTTNNSTVPAPYCADFAYKICNITAPQYIDVLLSICKKHDINGIMSMLDEEAEILAQNREKFNALGVMVFAPNVESAKICFDKQYMHDYLVKNNINTILTCDNLEDFDNLLRNGKISFPVFIKPKSGCGSVGAEKIDEYKHLREKMLTTNVDMIIQEYCDGEDIDADVYIDAINHNVVTIFSKKKLRKGIGGANATISYIDEALQEFIIEAMKIFTFYGTINIDLFYKNGKYYLSEINPRYGAGNLHAYDCGVDFAKYMVNNMNNVENDINIAPYQKDKVMIKYEDTLLLDVKDLLK